MKNVKTQALIWLLFIMFLFDNQGKRPSQDDLIMDLILAEKSDFDIKIREWHLFIDALIFVESMNNDSAVGKSNDVGALQITPIYLEEANRLVGERRFTLNDRFNRYKSIEMFTIINEKYNPERSFDKALRLHNPGGGRIYREKVLKKYKELINS